MWTLFGLLVLYVAVFEQVPAAGDLQRMQGEIRTYHVATRRDGEPRRVDFQLEGSDLEYWTDEIGADLVSGRLNGTRVYVEFYVKTGRDGPRRRMGTVKTYGWAVNGRQITSLAADLSGERGMVDVVAPVLSLLLFGIAGAVWLGGRRKR